MKYVQDLIEKILNFSVDFVIEPEGEQEDGDVVLGEVPMNLRKAYSLYRQKAEEHNIQATEFNNKKWKDAEERKKGVEEIKIALSPLKEEVELLEKMFWTSLRSEFKHPTGELAIRSGWKLVVPKEEEDDIFSGSRIIVVGSGFPFPFPFPPR